MVRHAFFRTSNFRNFTVSRRRRSQSRLWYCCALSCRTIPWCLVASYIGSSLYMLDYLLLSPWISPASLSLFLSLAPSACVCLLSCDMTDAFSTVEAAPWSAATRQRWEHGVWHDRPRYELRRREGGDQAGSQSSRVRRLMNSTYSSQWNAWLIQNEQSWFIVQYVCSNLYKTDRHV